MPLKKDLNSILIIGSGPIIIGQACEFDYSGSIIILGILIWDKSTDPSVGAPIVITWFGLALSRLY